jgi:seryl-tRNA synthetase
MIAIERILANPSEIERRLRFRGDDTDIASLLQLRRELEDIEKGGDASRATILAKQLQAALERLPAVPHETTPLSTKKTDFKIVREYGGPRLEKVTPSHVDIGGRLGMLDLRKATRLSGNKFAAYIGWGARLERALITYMLRMAANAGYSLIAPPLPWAGSSQLFTAGVLPKFADQVYKITGSDLFLVPTAEVLLSSLHNGALFDEQTLPQKYAAYTPCFRREAGAARATEPGLIRIHQFNKVELVVFTTPQKSYDDLEILVTDAERVLRGLGLHYRVILLPSCDLAQQATKAYDLQVWLPSINDYYEVSTCSNCEDYQARRGGVRVRGTDGRVEYAHTLNGSGVATSRLFAAILENNLDAEGGVGVPEILRSYMGGVERIPPIIHHPGG